MFFLILLFASILSSSIMPIPPHSDRYNPHKKIKNATHEPTRKPPIHRANENNTEENSESNSEENNGELDQNEMTNESLFDEEWEKFEIEQDSSPHTPLGTIYSEITEYCSYFIEHCMDGPLLNQQKEAFILFCNVLTLLTNLADSECAIIRLDSYISNIIEIIQALENASKRDDAITKHQTEFPLIASLQTAANELDDNDNSNTRFLIHHALRSPSSAKPFIAELFTELKLYTHHKLQAILNRFQEDTQQLLSISQQEEISQPTLTLIEQKSMEALSRLCRHAATTCSDLTHTMSESLLHTHTGALMTQIEQMLSTMAFTYNHLGTNKVRSQDRSSLAKRYTNMLESLSLMPPRRSPQSLITYINGLKTPYDKELFITNLFAAPRESKIFLGEFFPSFSDALEYNLEQFCMLLTQQVTETFTQRYWLSE